MKDEDLKRYIDIIIKDITKNYYCAEKKQASYIDAFNWCKQEIGQDGWNIAHNEARWYGFSHGDGTGRFYFKNQEDYTRFVLTWL